MTIPSELYDYLAPGDIRYCQCGFMLVDPKDPKPCVRCRRRLPGFDWSSPSGPDEENSGHSDLVAKAIELATKRRDSGVPPLFWMKGDSE